MSPVVTPIRQHTVLQRRKKSAPLGHVPNTATTFPRTRTLDYVLRDSFRRQTLTISMGPTAGSRQGVSRDGHMHAHHPDTPYFTLYEYTVGFPDITVTAVTDAGDLARSPEWHDAVARAAKSGGRMRLNVLRVTKDIFQDAVHTDFIVPLRAETSKVQDELKYIAREILDVETWKDGELPYGLMTSNGQDVSERLDMLLDSNVERTPEIH
ncbi:hypothetical protein B0H11DRAFT_2322455 [Mycena galericulata]|nr:hypothetical protein B0H11DRAFT_2322455 [Mycena galericulata]